MGGGNNVITYTAYAMIRSNLTHHILYKRVDNDNRGVLVLFSLPGASGDYRFTAARLLNPKSIRHQNTPLPEIIQQKSTYSFERGCLSTLYLLKSFHQTLIIKQPMYIYIAETYLSHRHTIETHSIRV